jgi:hypothetical protein
MKRPLSLLGAAAVTLTVLADVAEAKNIPAFARKYRVSCSLCHAPAPRLNAFGETFAGNGFEFAPGEPGRDTIATGDPLLRLQRELPLAVRFDAYLRAQNDPAPGQNSIDFQTPWVIKLLSGGQVANKVSYYMYFLLSERGEVAGLEDAYLQFTDVAGSGVSVIVGQFQVSDPLFKRELRLQYEDYQPYRVRVGMTAADLTYDRGAMALFSPWTGADMSVQLVAGRGLNTASGNRQYDPDDAKSTAFRLSQDVGPVRLGAFAYRGFERENGVRNTITIWGPDATVPIGSVGEVNLQYLRRTDRDPYFGTCSVITPCADGVTVPFGTTVDAGFAEVILWPQGPTGRIFLTGLFNLVDTERPVVSLRLTESGGQAIDVAQYRTASAGLHYLYRRNVRLMGEVGWDLEVEQARFILGSMVAF